MAKHRIEKFPLETPGLIPSQETTVAFHAMRDTGRPVMLIEAEGGLGHMAIYLTNDQLMEIIRLADGRMFNQLNISNELKSMAVEDQVFAMLRDNEKCLQELTVALGGPVPVEIVEPARMVAWAAVVIALKLIRAMKQGQ
jgi:hypothetical protein